MYIHTKEGVVQCLLASYLIGLCSLVAAELMVCEMQQMSGSDMKRRDMDGSARFVPLSLSISNTNVSVGINTINNSCCCEKNFYMHSGKHNVFFLSFFLSVSLVYCASIRRTTTTPLRNFHVNRVINRQIVVGNLFTSLLYSSAANRTPLLSLLVRATGDKENFNFALMQIAMVNRFFKKGFAVFLT